MFKNTFSRISYLLLFLLIALMYRFYVSYFFLLLMAAMVIFPVFSIALLYYMKDKLSFSLTCPTEIEQDSPFEVVLHMKNLSFFPVVRARFFLDFENLFYPQTDKHSFICGIPAGKENTITLRFDSSYSGIVTFIINKVSIWDYTGMADCTIKPKCSASLRIIPHILEADINTNAVGGAGLTELVEQDTKGNDSSQIIDTRDYQPGDKPNRIHWKLSTKLDRLLVKEYGSISSNDVLVLMELYKKPFSKKANDSDNQYQINQCFNACFSVYFTLMHHLIDEKRPFTLCWYSPSVNELKREEITSREEGTAVLDEMFYEALSTSPDSSLSLCQKTMDEFGDFIYIRPEYPECANEGQGEILFSCMEEEKPLASAVFFKR